MKDFSFLFIFAVGIVNFRFILLSPFGVGEYAYFAIVIPCIVLFLHKPWALQLKQLFIPSLNRTLTLTTIMSLLIIAGMVWYIGYANAYKKYKPILPIIISVLVYMTLKVTPGDIRTSLRKHLSVLCRWIIILGGSLVLWDNACKNFEFIRNQILTPEDLFSFKSQFPEINTRVYGHLLRLEGSAAGVLLATIYLARKENRNLVLFGSLAVLASTSFVIILVGLPLILLTYFDIQSMRPQNLIKSIRNLKWTPTLVFFLTIILIVIALLGVGIIVRIQAYLQNTGLLRNFIPDFAGCDIRIFHNIMPSGDLPNCFFGESKTLGYMAQMGLLILIPYFFYLFVIPVIFMVTKAGDRDSRNLRAGIFALAIIGFLHYEAVQYWGNNYLYGIAVYLCSGENQIPVAEPSIQLSTDPFSNISGNS